MLVYGHFDVQPPDPLELWESDPFELEERDDWLFGRGVADDKGQLYMLLKAASELAAAGELPVNVRVCCDAEEEIGGHQIVDFLAADERGADAAIIFDSGMTTRGVPEFNVATRGLVYFHLVLRTGARDLHSGRLRRRRAERDARAQHHALEGARAGRRAAGAAASGNRASDRAGARGLGRARAGGGSSSTRPACAARTPRPPRSSTCERPPSPPLDVNGIAGGSPVLQKTVLPVSAEANLSIRLAPGQDVDEIAAALDALLREAAPDGAELELTRLSSSAPGLVPPDAPAVQLGLDAFEKTFGRRPLLVRSGGTLPIVPALADKGIPTIITGFALPESNIHSPNERLLAEFVPLGLETARELFRSLASLGG